MEINWRKCPAVTTGGKQFFYVAFTDKGKLTIVWSRLEQKWLYMIDDIVYGLFTTSRQAMKTDVNTI